MKFNPHISQVERLPKLQDVFLAGRRSTHENLFKEKRPFAIFTHLIHISHHGKRSDEDGMRSELVDFEVCKDVAMNCYQNISEL